MVFASIITTVTFERSLIVPETRLLARTDGTVRSVSVMENLIRSMLTLGLMGLLSIICAIPVQAAKLAGDSSIDTILDALHDRGQGLKDFAGDVKMAESDASTGIEGKPKAGKVYYQNK